MDDQHFCLNFNVKYFKLELYKEARYFLIIFKNTVFLYFLINTKNILHNHIFIFLISPFQENFNRLVSLWVDDNIVDKILWGFWKLLSRSPTQCAQKRSQTEFSIMQARREIKCLH